MHLNLLHFKTVAQFSSFPFNIDFFHHLLSPYCILFDHEFWTVTIRVHLTWFVDFCDFFGFLLKLLKMVDLVVEQILNNWGICSLKLIKSVEDLVEVLLENISF